MSLTTLRVSLAVAVCALPLAARAQAVNATPGRTVVVTAGAHYKAGGFHRGLLRGMLES